MTKSKTRIRNIEFDLFDVGMVILLMSVAIIAVIIIGTKFVNKPSTPYLAFEQDYNQCLQSEIFAEHECYDIAYTATFGE